MAHCTTDKKIVFHIGDPKTGTTSIQEALFHRRWKSDTVLEPQAEKNAGRLADSLRFGGAVHRISDWCSRAKWANRLKADIGVISSEFFVGYPAALLKEATQDFKPHIQVVAYARNYGDRFLAEYSQEVKAGLWYPTPFQFAVDYKTKFKSEFYPRFSAHDDLFDFKLREFSRDKLVGGDVVTDFFDTVFDGAAHQVLENSAANESLSVESLSGVFRVQRNLMQEKINGFERLLIGTALGIRVAERAPKGLKLTLGPRTAQVLRNSYREDARKLDARFGTEFEQKLEDMKVDQFPEKINAQRFFSEATCEKLDKQACHLADLMRASNGAWRVYYTQLDGNGITLNLQEKLILKSTSKASITEIEMLLDDLADTITG